MYWNNPNINLKWPNDRDIVQESLHNGVHCLFYDPAVDIQTIHCGQTLSDLCNWANRCIEVQGLDQFLKDPNNHYDIANLVKLNIWVNDLQVRGSIKPMLLQYVGTEKFNTGTGESRLRALERIKPMPTVSAFISTHARYREKFKHLEEILTFDRFAEVCQAQESQQFLFRLTDNQAPYGLDWYEYDSAKTASVTPGQDYCVEVLTNYLKKSLVSFSPEWFDTTVEWDSYKNFQ